MSSNGSSSRRVNFSPDINDKQNISLKSNYRVTGGNRRRTAGISGFRVPKSSLSSSSSSQTGFSPMNFLCRLSNRVVRALRMVSLRRRRTSPKVSSSFSTSSSSSNTNHYNNLARSRSYVNHHHVDSHQSEAIEDCIQFINSSSSFQRSNSVSAC
ncbi:hypothetical protein MKX03_009838 [Papaver bracteatum]|nr:hypothetical protein MKX03_009838 [Papaver bracteatum]